MISKRERLLKLLAGKEGGDNDCTDAEGADAGSRA